MTTGERKSERPKAQDLSTHLGKILRITPDGGVPPDNPFVGRKDALPEIWSYGHRNSQGATLNPDTGQLWAIEHGPRGGDEINIPAAGKNYGWPIITYGREYSGPAIGEGTAKAGMEQRSLLVPPSRRRHDIPRRARLPGLEGAGSSSARSQPSSSCGSRSRRTASHHEERYAVGARARRARGADARSTSSPTRTPDPARRAGELIRGPYRRFPHPPAAGRRIARGARSRPRDLHATFKRDIECLRDRLNVPIVWSRERAAYVLDPAAEQAELPGVWFSRRDLRPLEIDHRQHAGRRRLARQLGRCARLAALLRARTMAMRRSAAASACWRSGRGASTRRVRGALAGLRGSKSSSVT